MADAPAPLANAFVKPSREQTTANASHQPLERLANRCQRPDTFLRFAHWRRAENLWISHARGPGGHAGRSRPYDPPSAIGTEQGPRGGFVFYKGFERSGAGPVSFSGRELAICCFTLTEVGREFREQYARVREGQGADVHPEFSLTVEQYARVREGRVLPDARRGCGGGSRSCSRTPGVGVVSALSTGCITGRVRPRRSSFR